MKLLEELERRRERVREQIREQSAELEAIEKIINGVQRDTVSNGNGSRAKRKRGSSGGDKRFAKYGLTEAILALTANWIAPAEIRDLMVAGGYNHRADSPLLGNIFATCKRLAQSKKKNFEVRKAGDRLEYRLKPESF
jgi:hypothetical protein